LRNLGVLNLPRPTPKEREEIKRMVEDAKQAHTAGGDIAE